MKRKSILALILAALVILSLSLVGCGNRYGTGSNGTSGNNAGRIDGTGYTRDTAQNDGSTTNNNSTNRNATTGEITDRTGADNNGTTRNNAGGMEGTNGFTRDNAWDDDGTNANNSNATRDKIKATADSIKYSAANFADDLRNSGYNLTESANTKKNYFKGNETDYLLGGDVVRLYEYGSPAELEGDINRIAPGGMTIHGTDANYTRSPYYYRKGNTLIMYEGNEPAYIDEFRNNYGNAITR